jgi:hypothetical protein
MPGRSAYLAKVAFTLSRTCSKERSVTSSSPTSKDHCSALFKTKLFADGSRENHAAILHHFDLDAHKSHSKAFGA